MTENQSDYISDNGWVNFINNIKKNYFSSFAATILLLIVYWFVVIGGGNLLVEEVFDPAFNVVIQPVLIEPIQAVDVSEGGNIAKIKMFFVGSGDEITNMLGIFSTALYVPLVMVLPFIIMFYIMNILFMSLGFGGVYERAFEPILKPLGVSGKSIVSFMLGFGCKVPAMLSSDTIGGKRSLLTSIITITTIPCGVQQEIILGILAGIGTAVVLGYWGITLVLFVVGLLLLKKIVGTEEGVSDEYTDTLGIKMMYSLFKIRMGVFFSREMTYMYLGLVALAFMNTFGLLTGVSNMLGGFFNAILGIPKEAAFAYIMALLQSEAGLGMLKTLELSPAQNLVFAVSATRFFACMGVLGAFFTMFGAKKTIYTGTGLLVFAFIVGFVLKIVLGV